MAVYNHQCIPSCSGQCVVTLVACVTQITLLQIRPVSHRPRPPPCSLCLRFSISLIPTRMKCCCSCKGDSWIRCVHFFLTFTILYMQLVNGRSGKIFLHIYIMLTPNFRLQICTMLGWIRRVVMSTCSLFFYLYHHFFTSLQVSWTQGICPRI